MIKFVHMDLDTIGNIDEALGPYWRIGETVGDRDRGYSVLVAEATIIRTSQMMPYIELSLGGLEINIDKDDFECMEVT